MSNKMMRTSEKRGYTLLELIVSLGIFSMVMLVVLGAYVTLISLDRKARANAQLASSLSFAIESMARSMRTGGEYVCNRDTSSPNCSNGGGSISFCAEGIASCRTVSANQSYIITYILKSDGTIGQCSGTSCTNQTAISLTDPRITISSLRFYVRGVDADNNPLTNDTIQPNVTFVVAGTMVTDAGETSNFSIQTGATQRLIEL